MKKRLLAVLSVILTFMMMGSTFSFAAQVNPVEGDTFTDVAADSWYKEYVDFVAENAYMIGTSETTFEPESNLTRAMFATILARYHGADVDDSKETIFKDVPVNQWYTGSIGWNNEKSIVQGYGDGNFGTNDFITRQDLATMIARYIDVYEADFGKIHQTHRPMIDYEFADAADIADYAVDTVKTCVDYGLLEGYPDKTFKPRQNITRAETAAIIYRLAWLTPGPNPVSTKYQVVADITVPFAINDKGKTTLTLKTRKYLKSVANKKTLDDIAEELVGSEMKNDAAIEGAADYALKKVKESEHNYTDGTYAVNLSTDGVISATKGAEAVNLPEQLEKEKDVYDTVVGELATAAAIPADAIQAWNDFFEACWIANMFDESGNDFTLKAKGADYLAVIQDEVKAATALHKALGTDFDYAGAITGVANWANANDIDLEDNYKINGTSISTIDTASNTDLAAALSYDREKRDDNKGIILATLDKYGTGDPKAMEVLSINETFDNTIKSLINLRTSRDLKGDGISAVLNSIVDNGSLNGDYSIKVTVKEVK